MRRWNGWGDTAVTYELADTATAFLKNSLGDFSGGPDAELKDVCNAVPASRVKDAPLFTTAAEERVQHARGQSLPDWVALRSGRLGVFPDAVAYPTNSDDVRELLQFAKSSGARLIPYGGGTSVVGHVNPVANDAPVITVDLSRMGQLLHLDETSRLATFGAGVRGPNLEAQLQARGYTLGHFPQSWELSTLGGWVATRSSGQQSLRYGRIEQLFAGGRLESPAGPLVIRPVPASAAGPDVREMVLGSEGRMGILTEVTVRISALPAREAFYAVFFPDWERGTAGMRAIAQARLPLSVLRLANAEETATQLILAGHANQVAWLERYLKLRGAGDGKCMAIIGISGKSSVLAAAREEALSLARKHGGVSTGKMLGEKWRKNRYRSAYLRNTLWELGYAVDTLETAVSWTEIPSMVSDVESALRTALEEVGEKVLAFTHLSHVYPSGSSAYTTYLFRRAADPEETLSRWQKLKSAASRAIVRHRGTISHQHGVGVDHRPYLAAEKGELGMTAIKNLCRTFDPDGLMSPGVLVE